MATDGRLSGTSLILLGAFAALGAFVQAVTGFGGALVLAPALYAILTPAQAVLLSAVLGVIQSGTMVAAGRATILRPELRTLLLAALPGLGVGAVVLREASPALLRLGVGIAVIAATALRLAGPRRGASGLFAVPTGFAAGALTTSVTINGPPLVLYLSARQASPMQIRSTLAALFLALDLLAAVPLALTGNLRAPPLAAVATVAATFPLGLALGLRLAPRLRDEAYGRVVTVLLILLGAASAVAGARALL